MKSTASLALTATSWVPGWAAVHTLKHLVHESPAHTSHAGEVELDPAVDLKTGGDALRFGPAC